MIKIENVVTMSREQYQAVIRGMRNPMNSWEKSDSVDCYTQDCDECCYWEICNVSLEDPNVDIRKFDGYFRMGENDLMLCKKLANGGPVHAKYRRMMVVYLDITAPLYW